MQSLYAQTRRILRDPWCSAECLLQCALYARYTACGIVNCGISDGILHEVAWIYLQYVQASGSRFGCIKAGETALNVPRVRVTRIRVWFGRVKGSLRWRTWRLAPNLTSLFTQ